MLYNSRRTDVRGYVGFVRVFSRDVGVIVIGSKIMQRRLMVNVGEKYFGHSSQLLPRHELNADLAPKWLLLLFFVRFARESSDNFDSRQSLSASSHAHAQSLGIHRHGQPLPGRRIEKPVGGRCTMVLKQLDAETSNDSLSHELGSE